MGMNLGISSDEPEVIMDINTTPLIDVMLVLLIMLIITIPIQLHAVNLDMPVPTNAPKTTEPMVVKIDVDATSVIYWNGVAIRDKAQLENLLLDAKSLNPQPELHIRSDAKAKYAQVASILASAQRIGLTRLGIVGTEQFAD